MDSQALIRAMWIGNPASASDKLDLIFQLGPRRFEHLVERLYDAMGFETTLTPPSRDGGRDIELAREEPGRRERGLVECKLYELPVGVKVVRDLLGVLVHPKQLSNKGTVVASSSFTKPARDFATADPRLELIGWSELLPLLDEHLGANWGRNVDRLLADSAQKAASTPTSAA